MSDYFSITLYTLVLLLLHAVRSIHGFNKSAEVKCIERERQILLNFKQGFFDPSGMLSTWRDDDNDQDCCKWRGIECHNETGHVQMLYLRGLDTQYLTGAIKISSLVHLQNIEYLDLSNNGFQWIHIPKLMGSFSKLKYLNLSYSDISGSIPCELGQLTHLQYLDLGGNILNGEIPYQLNNLSQLRYLGLGGYENSLSGAIPFQVGNLPNFNTLRLDGNFDVKSKDAEWLSNLYSLRKLDLNYFHKLGSSHHWLQTVSKLNPNLRELRLVGCTLSDSDIQSLFYSHSNFSTSLTILDLSSNIVTFSTFQRFFNFSLYNLQELYLSENNMTFPSSVHPNFPSLWILDLSYNNTTSLVFQGNFNVNSKLQKFYLQNCSLMDGNFLTLPTSTVNYSSSSLQFLDLSSNLLESSAIFHLLFNFTTNLHTLHLYGNLLEGPIPDGFGKVMNSLEDLDLSSKKLQGKLPTFFGNMCTLQSLDLSENNLSGEISSFIQNSSWCNRHIFKRLHLDYNRISGFLPKSIGLLSKLEVLSFKGNFLEGDVTESHLSNFPKLKHLFLSNNSLSLKFVSGWVPPFQLNFLGLAFCNLGPSFPSWLQTQSSLSILDISNSGISEFVPEWLWNKSQHMILLNMGHNNLTGEIPSLPFKFSFSPVISPNSNQFEGSVPSFLIHTSELLLFKNKFSDLFTFLCDRSEASNLVTLDLSNNQIKGQLPDCWKSVNSLVFLDLSFNKLSGKVPPSMGSLVELEALVLRNNSLVGELPSTLKNCINLIVLDVSENMLSGPIPSWIGENLLQLIILSIRGNGFFGKLPIHLSYLKSIQLLDLSRNNLSEGIPTCLNNFTAMSEKGINTSEAQSYLSWRFHAYFKISGSSIFYFTSFRYQLNITFMWKGVEHGFMHPDLGLKSIDLSSNNLIGEIPKEVGYLLGLVSLNLSRNNLSGEINFEIGNLSSLEFLDLSRNNLSGRIPSSLSQLDTLGVLDLSHNSLSGRIPLGRHLDTFDASSFEGNIDLCGEQLNKSCPEDQTTVKPQGPAVHGDDSVFYEALYMSMGVGYFTGFWSLMGSILLWQPWRNAYVKFLNRSTNMVVENVAKR